VLYADTNDGLRGVDSGPLDGDVRSLRVVPSERVNVEQRQQFTLRVGVQDGPRMATIDPSAPTLLWSYPVAVNTFPRIRAIETPDWPNARSYPVATGITFVANATDYDNRDGRNAGIESYVWRFGDDRGGEGAAVTHVYEETGLYMVSLTVTDNEGLTTTETREITVVNEAPVGVDIQLSQSTGLLVDETIELVALATDPEGQDQELRYHWDLGDGTEMEGQRVSHRYSDAGVYDVTLSVTDRLGGQTVYTTTVTVTNMPPRFDQRPSPVSHGEGEFIEDEQIQFTALAHDPDEGTVTYAWDFGDGFSTSGRQVVHSFARSGEYTVTLTVTDDEGATTTATVPVSVRDSTIFDFLRGLSVEESVAVAGLLVAIATPLLKIAYDTVSRRRERGPGRPSRSK
jgi:PKD repeat protein